MKRTQIRQFSSKRQKDMGKYRVLRRKFLEENDICQIRKTCFGAPATVISHLKGRGIYFLDVSTWGASCLACEAWLTNNTRWAIKEGLAFDRIGTSKEPIDLRDAEPGWSH